MCPHLNTAFETGPVNLLYQVQYLLFGLPHYLYVKELQNINKTTYLLMPTLKKPQQPLPHWPKRQVISDVDRVNTL